MNTTNITASATW